MRNHEDIHGNGHFVKITSKDIIAWAQRLDARGELPRLVRRLANHAGTITQIAFPAGESISRPGWDGEILSDAGDPWVPAGRSFWELSVEHSPTRKANSDYNKRTDEMPEQVRQDATFVALTARHWANKGAWAQEKQAEGHWKDVRAYDADDLEFWIEANPAVALAFAEEIGLAGDGVESIARHWQAWASQCQPPILPGPFFADRDQARGRLLTGLHDRVERNDDRPYAIRADSVAEAAAFVCAALLREAPALADAALVVTAEQGWRFVASHPRLKLAIAARPEIAHRPASNLVTVVPVAAGDLASGYGGKGRGGFDLVLERPSIYAFRDALIEIGVEESDARRLARATGRSWTVLRRRLAANPAIRSPQWLQHPDADALSMLCLLGAWDGDQAADRAIVEHLAGVQYETVESNLRRLALVDDAPVIVIGKVWRAKAPLELLDLHADRIAADELGRFFEVVESLLVQPDPQLELEPDQRWMAPVYGKVRAVSGLLFESVCDALVKLAVRGPDYPGLAAHQVEYRVAHLVEGLPGDADATRWLSLASHLRPLAEAAPETFLKAVESSLDRRNAPIERLFREGSSSKVPIMGTNWWFTDLLWALEILAWSPRWMPRVAVTLARLSSIQLPENWGNRPSNSLLGIFRAWWPRTAADLNQRIAVLDGLIKTEPEVAFELMDRLLHNGPDMASPSAEPVWREDDAGSGGSAPVDDYYGMLVAAADRLVAMAAGHAARLVRLLDKLTILDPERADRVLVMVSVFTEIGADDLDRELLRGALRNKLHWQIHYGQHEPDSAFNSGQLDRWRELYDTLAPLDLVIRKRWLFQNGWVDLPVASDEDDPGGAQRREEWRKDALREVHQERGLDGILDLAECCGDAAIVGRCLLAVLPDHSLLADWIIRLDPEFAVGTPHASMISGLVRCLTEAQSESFLRHIIGEAGQQQWPPERIASFLRLARDERRSWDLAEACGDEVTAAYWNIVTPWLWQATAEDRGFVVSRLLRASRPIAALNTCLDHLNHIAPELLALALDEALRTEEPGAKFPAAWHLAKLIERLEAWDGMDQERLLQIEFQLVPAFRLRQAAGLKALTKAATSQPELFAELIRLIYRPENGERSDAAPTDGQRIAAENAWGLLHDCRRQPGTLPNGEIDPVACIRFVDDALALCRQQDRLTMGEQTIGQLFAHAPEGEDGIWPGPPARDILNRRECEQMRSGFQIGIINRRGMTSRAMDEGGAQERTLAASFRRHADALAATHPFLSATLEGVARSYEADAQREDDQAALNRERY